MLPTIGTALNNSLGREDGVVLGQTFATVGLLVGLFVGIACIIMQPDMEEHVW